MTNSAELIKQNCQNEILLIEMARYLLSRKKLIIFLTLAAMVLASAKVLMEPNRYSSTASLLPSGNISNTNSLGKLAGFLNNNISDENSSELYPVILSSRLIRNAILSKEYEFDDRGQTRILTLPEYFETKNPDQQKQALFSMTKIKTDPATGSIFLAVESEYPGLSQAVLRAYLFELENYNLFKRNSQGQRSAEYLKSRLNENKIELTEAEDRLETYRLANQNWAWTTDPTIVKELRQLGRGVEVLSESYLNLLEKYDMARQNAQNDLPIVLVLDKSSLPTIKSGPRRTITVLLFGAATFFMTIFALLAQAIYRHKTEIENNKQYQTLSGDIGRTISSGRQIFRILKKSNKKELSATKV